MKTHELKIKVDFADAIISGDKMFELRENDRGFQKGDRIRFTAINKYNAVSHEINSAEYEITYVLNGWGLIHNYVALGIRRVFDGLE